MKRKLLATAFVLFGTLLTGCVGHGGYIGARYGPPAPRYGAVGYAPGPGYVWTDGYWDYRGGNWAWAPGRWVRPPHARARWTPGYWRQEGRGWRFHRGYWR
jgi:YXWGXW repeat-containing protein